MNEKLISGIIALIVIALIIIFILVIVMVAKNKPKAKTVHIAINKDSKGLDIEDLISIVSDKKSTKEDIFKASQYFIKNFKIPPKLDGKAPPESKIYLRFIALVAAHKNSDAKIIAYIDNEIKKSNSKYGNEIDKYERNGIARRTRF
ncbi:fatty-acid--CoA ligase [Campylobacter fetus]|nr:fatty-acid--CoA ligase [Campylobacter fetus]